MREESEGSLFLRRKEEITRIKRRNQRTKKRKERKQLEERSDRKEKGKEEAMWFHEEEGIKRSEPFGEEGGNDVLVFLLPCNRQGRSSLLVKRVDEGSM